MIGLRISSQAFDPLTFYDDEGELVGIYGVSNEIRFIPSFGDQRGSLVSIDRLILNCNYRSFNDSPFDPPGPGKKKWQVYFGDYFDYDCVSQPHIHLSRLGPEVTRCDLTSLVMIEHQSDPKRPASDANVIRSN